MSVAHADEKSIKKTQVNLSTRSYEIVGRIKNDSRVLRKKFREKCVLRMKQRRIIVVKYTKNSLNFEESSCAQILG